MPVHPSIHPSIHLTHPSIHSSNLQECFDTINRCLHKNLRTLKCDTGNSDIIFFSLCKFCGEKAPGFAENNSNYKVYCRGYSIHTCTNKYNTMIIIYTQCTCISKYVKTIEFIKPAASTIVRFNLMAKH